MKTPNVSEIEKAVGSKIVKKTDILILGAGCSGTSLTNYLEDFGYQGKVVLLDLRTNFDREQRWCSWAKMPDSIAHLVEKSWDEWTVCDESRTKTQTSESLSYKQTHAPKFFSHFHSKWRKDKSNIELSLGEKVEQVTELDKFVEVVTDKETWQAQIVFDARNEGSDNLKSIKKDNEVYLFQTFLGWEVEFAGEVFDERKVTLMDFRTDQLDGINFIYVLPYSKSRALIESTSFSTRPQNCEEHSQSVRKYIAENYHGDFKIKAEESGQLPMTTRTFPTKSGDRIFNIGIAGGNARPSSGYAFHRIQRHASSIAKAIVSRQNIPTTFANPKYNFFDDVFLNLISENPIAAKDAFLCLFEKVPADILIRFLSDESSYADDLAIITALPKISFGRLGLKTILKKLIAKNGTAKPLTNIHNPLVDSARRLDAGQVSR